MIRLSRLLRPRPGGGTGFGKEWWHWALAIGALVALGLFGACGPPVGRDVIKRVMDELGCGDRVVIGHDICTRHRLVRYGGHGYGHIFENIAPRMLRRGFSEGQVGALTRGNAARVLAFV